MTVQAGAVVGREVVTIRGLFKRFGTATVLDDVNLGVRRGEFLSLLGPSGCGKTTLLRIIAGFERQSAGQVEIDGRDVSGTPAYARNTNMIFQQLALFPHMTVFRNIAFGLRMKKVGDDLIRRKVGEMLDLIQLPGYEGRMPDQLSGGQRQRVALARALVNGPDVLLLDEPLGALDLQLRLQLQVELRRLHKSLGNTFIFVTHDQAEALTMSDRIAVMNQGRVVQLGTPEEIYEAPRARFVANFVGHTNLFAGRLTLLDGAGLCSVELGAGKPALRCAAPAGGAVGAEVSVAIRYEKIALTAEGTGPAGGAAPGCKFAGVIKDRLYMGGFLRFCVLTDWGREVTADAPVSDAMRLLTEGSRVAMHWAPADAAVLTA